MAAAACWNGIALAVLDIAKRHTTRKRHVDVGMRVADYPTIQDYVGECLMDTNASRLFVYSVAQAMDSETADNTRTLEVGDVARALVIGSEGVDLVAQLLEVVRPARRGALATA